MPARDNESLSGTSFPSSQELGFWPGSRPLPASMAAVLPTMSSVPATEERRADSGGSRTDVTVTSQSLRWVRWGAFSAGGLFVLAALYTLHAARPVLLPFATAVLLSFPLRPLVRLIARSGLSRALGAALVVGALGGTLAFGAFTLSESALHWLRHAPQVLTKVQQRLQHVESRARWLRQATGQIEKLGRIERDPTGKKVIVHRNNLDTEVLGQLRAILTGAAITLLLLYFILGWGNLLFRNLIAALPRFRNQRQAVVIFRDVERAIALYLGTVTLINAGLGMAVAVAMYLLGLPNPALWGVVAALLNFMPYVGPLITLSILTLVGMLTYPSLGQALFPPAVFLALATLEGQIITPLAVGRRLAINPLLIFLSVFFWYWMWGVVGALITVPLLVCARIAFERFESTRGLGILLGGDGAGERRPLPPDGRG
jgi:predicted PurR-regulated permease PerM